MKTRLDRALVKRGLVVTRSQAESYIKLGKVRVAGKLVSKAGFLVSDDSKIELTQPDQYVSRAGLKLAGAAEKLGLDFKGKIVLDVGSSTGGFTDYALKLGAKKVIAVDIGTNQLHPSLRDDPRVEVHQKTDIRNIRLQNTESGIQNPDEDILHSKFSILNSPPDIVLIDVSFISLREILPSVVRLSKSSTQIVVLLKPQFEAKKDQLIRGIVKNDAIRRQILKDFENRVKRHYVIKAKADSNIPGSHGNRERFYMLTKVS